MSRVRRIEEILRRRFEPLHLEVRDDSARHAGHPGAAAGGGHFSVTVVSAAFEGLDRLAQHRAVYDALGQLMGDEVHALALRTAAPSEWTRRPTGGRLPGAGAGGPGSLR